MSDVRPRADRAKLEKLFEHRAELIRQLEAVDMEIRNEQSICTCPEIETLPSGEKYCPDCFYIWSFEQF
ncbi:hypothetical protein [Paenibacillus thalictri]|uniref:Uncharacterized protein n=1 Tax=Paenibacillus thalictri TaxID=2527873 RepID=A0A4Q9DHV7_9BACL|nr:hypothetical protein [Paenibacillus thalictri]TBL71556.1 hypothetical protein EYB31_29705 [Paenibacillus thalictri]